MPKKLQQNDIPMGAEDVLYGYYRLNHIKPKFFKIDEWTPERIQLTYKILKIPVKKTKAKKEKSTKGGSAQILMFT